jgi:peptidyl-tRNA hydrolase
MKEARIMLIIGAAMKIANEFLAPIAATKKKKRLEQSPYAGQNLVVVEVGTIALPKTIHQQLDAMGVWAALEHGKEIYKQLRAMRLA